MVNPNDRDDYTREVRRETYQDPNGNTHSQVSRTTSQVNTRRANPSEVAYRDGYVSGQATERRLQQQENQVVRDNDNAARGLLLGIIITSVIGVVVGSLFFLNQQRQTPAPVAPVIVPTSPTPAPTPEATQPPARETTIIERVQEIVPVPQPQSPAPAPNVNITVPPAQPQAPEATPTQPQTSDPASTVGSPEPAPPTGSQSADSPEPTPTTP